MEAQHAITLSLLPLGLILLILFALGYWLGGLKSKKLVRKMIKMEKTIMDLNTELLYGPQAVNAKADPIPRRPSPAVK